MPLPCRTNRRIWIGRTMTCPAPRATGSRGTRNGPALILELDPSANRFAAGSRAGSDGKEIMRRHFGSIALLVLLSLAFWPFGQIVNGSESEWCAKLNPGHSKQAATHDHPRSESDHAASERMCCHDATQTEPPLVRRGPELNGPGVSYTLAQGSPISLPSSPFRGLVVPPG